MKTIARLLFIAIACFIVTQVNAQSNPSTNLEDSQFNSPTALTDLQNQLQYLQSAEASIKNEIAVAQADLVSQQDLVASLDIQIADETASGQDVTDMQAERSQALAMIANLQAFIAQKQSELASIQNEISGVANSIQALLHNKAWLSTYMPSSTSSSTFQNPQQAPVNNNNQNSTIGVLRYTGNPQQDAQIIQDWLRQHGLLDNPVDSQ
jgi:chromosome segregation ATPase